MIPLALQETLREEKGMTTRILFYLTGSFDVHEVVGGLGRLRYVMSLEVDAALQDVCFWRC